METAYVRSFYQAHRMLKVVCVCMALRWVFYYQPLKTSRLPHWSPLVLVILWCFCVYMILKIRRARRGRYMMTSGPYRLLAHPVYTMYFLIDLPFWFLGQATWYAITSAILFYLGLVTTAYLEERHLICRFGDEARDYYQHPISVHFVLARLF